MKKLLLLLSLFLSLSINAQPPTAMPPYGVCDSNDDGFALFDLSSQIPAILNGLNPNTTQVTFHETLSDSQIGANAIVAINAYANISPQNQTVYIRVVDNANIEVYFSTMNLVMATNANAGTGGSVTLCETSSIPIDLFSLITGEQSGGLWTRTVGTGGIFNQLAGTYTAAPGATTSIFTYTVNSSCGSDYTTATINIIAQPNAGIDGAMTICDSSTTPVNLFSLITGEQPGGVWTRTVGIGGTFNAATGTYTPAVGATTSSFTYMVTGAVPCVNDTSVANITVNDCSSQTLCGGTFTDSGGASSNYSNNTNTTTTICPNNPGEAVMVTFTSFNTEANYDALYVYDGNTAIGSNLIPSSYPAGNVPGGIPGGYWGNLTGANLPGPFISSHTTGCLTFRFLSDGTNTLEGWVANVACNPIPLTCPPPTNLTISAVTVTSATLSWTPPANTFAWEVIVVPYGSPVPTVGVASNSTTYNLTGLSPNSCYVAYIKTLCQSQLGGEWVSINFCTYSCENSGECPDNLTLIAFLDANNNGIKDSGEDNFYYGAYGYEVNSSAAIYGSSYGGAFTIFESNPANSYNLSFTLNSNLAAYYSSTTTYSNITVPAGSGSNTYYFPVTQLQPYNDLEVLIIPSNNPRPGFFYTNYVIYKNKGTQTVASGTVTFTKHPTVAITAISQSGTTTNPSGFSYSFTNLAPNESRTIYVTMQVPVIPTVNLNDILTNTALIEPNLGDAYPLDNYASLSQIVVGSYDPNDKIESHGGKIVYSTFTVNDYLYYTIQFENTGTANAEFIRVNDLLDPKLDENTFEMLNASHSVRTKREGNQLDWYFYDIDLPPTSLNPDQSHGYIHFKIKPKEGYAIGDIIPNHAAIYFDFNPPIITNVFNTEFVPFLSNPNFNSNTISLSPNPASNIVTITNNNSLEKIAKISIYDVTGKNIYSLNDIFDSTFKINVSHFAKGIYLIEILSDSHSKITKKLILK
jgi:hypothetical protein